MTWAQAPPVDMAIALGAGCILFASRTFVIQVLERAPLGRKRTGAEVLDEESETEDASEVLESNVVEDKDATTVD